MTAMRVKDGFNATRRKENPFTWRTICTRPLEPLAHQFTHLHSTAHHSSSRKRYLHQAIACNWFSLYALILLQPDLVEMTGEVHAYEAPEPPGSQVEERIHTNACPVHGILRTMHR